MESFWKRADFAWDRKNFSQVDKVVVVLHCIDKDAGPSGLEPKMIRSEREAGIDMITELATHIIVDGVLLLEWEISISVKCHKGKRDALERNKHRELKFTDWLLEIVEKVIEKMMRQQLGVDEMQFGFMPEHET